MVVPFNPGSAEGKWVSWVSQRRDWGEISIVPEAALVALSPESLCLQDDDACSDLMLLSNNSVWGEGGWYVKFLWLHQVRWAPCLNGPIWTGFLFFPPDKLCLCSILPFCSERCFYICFKWIFKNSVPHQWLFCVFFFSLFWKLGVYQSKFWNNSLDCITCNYQSSCSFYLIEIKKLNFVFSCILFSKR